LTERDTPEIVYDLTEVFIASTGKYSYYGIVRVVEEIGQALYRLDPAIRFGVFSHAHQKFYEVRPSRDEKTGQVSLNVPQGVRQIHHLRQRFYTRSRLRDLLLSGLYPVVQRVNRRRWDNAGVALPELDMNGKTLVSTGRPKHMVAALDALNRAGTCYDFVPLLHDMFPLHEFLPEKPKRFPLSFIGDNCHVIKHARTIIAISDFTQKDIQNFSHEGLLPPLPEIVTVPLVQQCLPGLEPARISLPETPYILIVGANLGRKNLEAVCEALLQLTSTGAFTPRLVLAGAPRKRIQRYLLEDRYKPIRDLVEKIPNPNQTDLGRLYEHAMALILPSRIEGWGLPAGEALWCGTPAICSTAPVLREVCGDLGLYFDPNKPQELAEIITRLHTDTAYAQALRNRISESKPDFRTWADVARGVRHAVLTGRETQGGSGVVS
jgi:glycosyltransferase involved in cell wall biosynthesis